MAPSPDRIRIGPFEIPVRYVRPEPLIEPDRCDAEPRPPTQRGWEHAGLPLESAGGPHPIGVNMRTGEYVYVTVPPVARIALEARGVPDTASVDRTFENEVRPR